jgi:glycosyltransferase involved in cell wall biosynthesis
MDKNEPLFSVIIATYNRANELVRCLNSLVSQTFKDFEVIVCDDGSTDNSKDVVYSFSNLLNIKYFWNENWGGPAKPRNIGINASQGKWICFLDSDDWWYPNKLSECLKYLNDFDLIYHDMHVYTYKGRNLWRHRKGRTLSKNAFEDLILNGNAMSNSSVVVSKSILNEVGSISEDINLVAVEDYDYWIRVSKITSKFCHIPQYLAGYYWVGGVNNLSFSISQIDQVDYLFDKYIKILPQDLKNEAIRRHDYRKGRLYQLLNEKDNAIIYYKSSIKSSQFSTAIKSYVFLILLKMF